MSELKDVSIKEGGGGGDTFDEIKQVVGAFSGDAVVLHIEKTPEGNSLLLVCFSACARPVLFITFFSLPFSFGH